MKTILFQRGFTLVEVLVSTSIIGLLVPLIGTGVFQSVNTSERIGGDLQPAGNTRGAVQWLSRDIPMALTTDLTDGAVPVSGATFTWTDLFNNGQTAHSVSYSLSGNDLRRTYDGLTSTVGRNVTSVAFSRAGRLVTITITAQSSDRFQTADVKTIKVFYRSNG